MKEKSSSILIISIVIGVLFIAGIIFFVSGQKPQVTLPINIVEYSDFQCPYCALHASTHQKLESEFGEDVTFTFKHFPLSSIHQYAFNAAVAAEAAREQDKFYEYHDQLFANQNDLSDDNLLKIAEDLGLDMEKFTSDFKDNEAVSQRVLDNLQEAESKGYNGTPTFEINGKRIPTMNQDDLLARIRRLVKEGREQAN